MEKNIVTSGKTIDLAIEAALQTLGLDRDSVCVQVLQQAKPGFLGFGAQPAKVQVTYEAPDPVPEAPKVALSSASRSAKPKERPDLTPSVISRPGKKPVEQPKKSAEGRKDAPAKKARAVSLYEFEGLGKKPVTESTAGNIIALSGIGDITIGDTICDPAAVEPLPFVKISAPTMEMTFSINDSPFAGREGKFVTSRQLRERLFREVAPSAHSLGRYIALCSELFFLCMSQSRNLPAVCCDTEDTGSDRKCAS